MFDPAIPLLVAIPAMETAAWFTSSGGRTTAGGVAGAACCTSALATGVRTSVAVVGPPRGDAAAASLPARDDPDPATFGPEATALRAACLPLLRLPRTPAPRLRSGDGEASGRVTTAGGCSGGEPSSGTVASAGGEC